MLKVLKTGTWLYGGAIRRRVQIIQQDWDYYHELELDELPPELDEHGHAYYFAVLDVSGEYESRSNTFLSMDDAVQQAGKYGEVQWDEQSPSV